MLLLIITIHIITCCGERRRKEAIKHKIKPAGELTHLIILHQKGEKIMR
jgi:hypothetical protein